MNDPNPERSLILFPLNWGKVNFSGPLGKNCTLCAKIVDLIILLRVCGPESLAHTKLYSRSRIENLTILNLIKPQSPTLSMPGVILPKTVTNRF